MKVIKYILFLVFVLVFIRTEAQVHDVIFTARFQNVPFPEFVSTVEQQTGAQFYYIKISASGNQVSLYNTLLKALENSGLHFYITEDNQVFITGEQLLVTTLPDYSVIMDSSGIPVEDDPDNGMTTAEKRYFEARKTGVIEIMSDYLSDSRLSGGVVQILLAIFSGVMSLFVSGFVVNTTFFALVPGLATGLTFSPGLLFSAIAVGSIATSVSPFSGSGGLVVACIDNEEKRVKIFNSLLIWPFINLLIYIGMILIGI